MIVTGILTAVVIGCLLFGSMTSLPLVLVSLLSGIAFAILGQHNHGDRPSVEAVAVSSGLSSVSPVLKTWGSLALLVLGVSSGIKVGLVLTFMALVIQLVLGKMKVHEYLSLLALPLNFLLISALALLFEWTNEPSGLINLGLFGGWLSVSVASQARTAVVVARALGALSSLYLLSLSTPLHEIIAVMRRARVPEVVTDLMYLIYRYVYILMDLHRSMRTAAESRLGFRGYTNSIRSTGMIFSNLLICSFRKANASFDAMESRCFESGISFKEEKKAINARDLILVILVLVLLTSIAIWGDLI